MLEWSAQAIDKLAPLYGPISLMREAPGSYPDGRWQPGTVTTTTIFGVYQPTTRENARELPEGQFETATKTLWTRVDIQDADEATQRRADELVIEGETYRVMRALPRTEAGFTKAFLSRVRDAGRSD